MPSFSEKAPNSSSSWNSNGAHHAARQASMVPEFVGENNVQIITMYGYEVGKIRESLAGWWREGIHVHTVDSFQGEEDQIVVVHFSAAWKTRQNPIGFLTDLRRLNVAIMRAQSFMFVIGHLSFWEARIQLYSGKE